MTNIIEIDLNDIMMEIEKIVSKYIKIDDINLCFFAPNKRYPLDKKTLKLYNPSVLRNTPYLPLYSSGIVKDTILFALYDRSPYKMHFFKNVLTSNEEYRMLYTTDKSLYRVTDKDCSTVYDVVTGHIDDTVGWKREGLKVRTAIELREHYQSRYGKNFKKKTKNSMLNKRLKEINLKFLTELDDICINISDNNQNDDFEILVHLLSNIVSYIDNLNLPNDRIIDIDDENIKHRLIIKENILARRFAEAGKL